MLINSLSLLFTFTDFIGWAEVLSVSLVTLLAVYWLTPQPAPEWELRKPGSLYFYLQWSWLGYLNLKDAFWPFFILFNSILLYIDYRVANGNFTVGSWKTMHLIMAMPLVYWTGAVWRCSNNCSSKIWATVARCLTLAAYLDYALRWVILKDYPQIMFNCQQMLIEWGDCF